jgi:hypothetical protein
VLALVFFFFFFARVTTHDGSCLDIFIFEMLVGKLSYIK